MRDLAYETQQICVQLDRYGSQVASDELADVLWQITNINDDMHHLRSGDLIREGIARAKALLDALSATITLEDYP